MEQWEILPLPGDSSLRRRRLSPSPKGIRCKQISPAARKSTSFPIRLPPTYLTSESFLCSGPENPPICSTLDTGLILCSSVSLYLRWNLVANEAVGLLGKPWNATLMSQWLPRHRWGWFPPPSPGRQGSQVDNLLRCCLLESQEFLGSTSVASSTLGLPLEETVLTATLSPHVSPPKHANPLGVSHYYTFVIYFLWFRTPSYRFMNTRREDQFSPTSALFKLAPSGMSFYSGGYRYDIKSLRSWAALFGAWHLMHVKWLGSDISFPLSKNTSLEKIWCSLAKEGSRKLKPAWSFVSHGKLAKFTMKIIWKHEVSTEQPLLSPLLHSSLGNTPC